MSPLESPVNKVNYKSGLFGDIPTNIRQPKGHVLSAYPE